MIRVRMLGPGDDAMLEAFLAGHAESSMFLRANARAAGLVDDGKPRQATYFAAEEDGTIAAVAAHLWNGVVLLQAPVYLAEVVGAAVRGSGRRVSGVVGPWGQTAAARRALGLETAALRLNKREELFSLSLDALVVPPALVAGHVRCRTPRLEEIERLVEWRVAYHVEVLRAPDDRERRRLAREEVERSHAEESHWVLVLDDDPVAYSAFNARLPDMAQVGGVWTPPPLRGRGYARCVVAGSLLVARAQAVSRAVLFTDEDNVAAKAAYRALGFTVVGDYGLCFFESPHPAGRG